MEIIMVVMVMRQPAHRGIWVRIVFIFALSDYCYRLVGEQEEGDCRADDLTKVMIKSLMIPVRSHLLHVAGDYSNLHLCKDKEMLRSQRGKV